MAAPVYQVIDIISSAMRLDGSLAPGETPNASEATDFFNRLGDIIDRANADRLMLLPPIAATLTGGSSKIQYAIGIGAADFNQARPTLIQSFAHVVGGVRNYCAILDSVGYASISDPNATSLVITKVFCDYGNPIANLNVWPKAATPTFEMYAWTQLAQFATIFDTVNLPPAYASWLQWALAMDIASDLGTPANIVQLNAPMAAQYKAEARALNQQYLASAHMPPAPNVGNPQTTGINLASPTIGGPVQMAPVGGGQ